MNKWGFALGMLLSVVVCSTASAGNGQTGITLGHAHCTMQVITYTWPYKPLKDNKKLTVAASSWCDHKMNVMDQDLYIQKACPCPNPLLDHEWSLEFDTAKGQIDAFTYDGYKRWQRNVFYCVRFHLHSGTAYGCASVLGV